MSTPLKYLSDTALSQLRKDIPKNLDRYCSGSFVDMANDPGWDIPLGVEFDADRLASLDHSTPRTIAPVDLKNSKIVGEALSSLDVSTANEERVWVRLAHVEAVEYSRARWVDGIKTDKLQSAIEDHFFAPTQTGIRDDHALSRLWWNYEIAKTCQPEDIEGALELILKSADIRSNFVERIWMTSRRSIAGAVLRSMRSEPWISEAELNFREFMKAINRFGGGIVFEALSEDETSEFVSECVDYAKAHVSESTT